MFEGIDDAMKKAPENKYVKRWRGGKINRAGRVSERTQADEMSWLKEEGNQRHGGLRYSIPEFAVVMGSKLLTAWKAHTHANTINASLLPKSGIFVYDALMKDFMFKHYKDTAAKLCENQWETFKTARAAFDSLRNLGLFEAWKPSWSQTQTCCLRIGLQ